MRRVRCRDTKLDLAQGAHNHSASRGLCKDTFLQRPRPPLLRDALYCMGSASLPSLGFLSRLPPESDDSLHWKNLQLGSEVLAGLLGFITQTRFILGQHPPTGNKDREEGGKVRFITLACDSRWGQG